VCNIDPMKEELSKIYRNAKSLKDSMEFAYLNDDNKISQYGSFKNFARKYNDLTLKAHKLIDVSLLDVYDIEKLKHPASLTWPDQKLIFDGVLMNIRLLISVLENELDVKDSKTQEIKNFLASNLRKAIFEIPKNEIDVQDSSEKLLIGKGLSKGIDYDRETGRVKVSIKEVIPDFIFPKFSLALEVKFSKDKTKSKAIIDEINADIRSYSKDYANIIFLIYDLGSIRDEDEFKNDLDNKENIQLLIIKH
jgi:hypothetical protein